MNDAFPAPIQLTEIQRLEQEIRNYPSAASANLQLAGLYEAVGRLHDAQRVLTRALEATDGATDGYGQIREKWEQVTMLQARRRVEMAQAQLSTTNSSEAKKAWEQAQRELTDLEIDIFHSRCEREPNNMAFRYEFALRLQREGNLPQAMQYLQQAAKDPAVRGPATLALGGCLQQLQQIPQALRSFRQAAAACLDDQIEHKKLALYRAGSLASAIRLAPQARRYFQQLVRIDPHYKDAASRLQSLSDE